MSSLGVVTALLGVLIILARFPLIVAPDATLRLYRRLIATPTGVRGLGLLLAVVAVALIAASSGGGRLFAQLMGALGWLLAALSGFLLIFPTVYQRLASSILSGISDPLTLRAIGALGVGIGAGLLALGLSSP